MPGAPQMGAPPQFGGPPPPTAEMAQDMHMQHSQQPMQMAQQAAPMGYDPAQMGQQPMPMHPMQGDMSMEPVPGMVGGRNPIVTVLLIVLTCGIYGIYLLVKGRKNQQNQNPF